ncbi:MAG: hypothetical protein V1915_02720 [Candidatus Bathyarchaeota archaeon]
MKVILYTNNPGKQEVLLLYTELMGRGHSCTICTTWSINLPHKIQGIPEADLVYVVTPVLFNGSAFELANRLVTLEEWDRKSVLINPFSALLKSTKAYFTNSCSWTEIPHPETLITESIEKALDFALGQFQQNKQVILKPLARGEGTGIKLLQPMDSETTLRFLLWYSSEYGKRVFYLQEFMENLNYDIRLFVIDNRIVTRMKRSKSGDFRFNLAQGAIAVPYQETKYDELAIKSAQVIGVKVAGVDILPTNKGPVVLEVNSYPGFAGLVQTTNIHIPKLLIDYFESYK